MYSVCCECLLYSAMAKERSSIFGDNESILLPAGMGGFSLDKIGVYKMTCEGQNYNEKNTG